VNFEPVSVVLVAHNEVLSIRRDVEGYYWEVVAKIPGSELIVSEDGSTDGTSELLRELASAMPIRLVQGTERKGYIQALLDALELPENEWILFSDTGGKFSPDNFWRMERLRSDADLIIGIKLDRRDQLYRRWITKVFNLLVRRYFTVETTDIDSGLRLFRREVFFRAAASPLIFKDLIATELTLRMLAAGSRFREVPVVYHLREGKSKGMPPQKIPRVVCQTLKRFPVLRQELVRLRRGRGF